MPSRRAILERLTREELLEIATLGSIEVSSKPGLATNDRSSPKAVLGEVLRRYSLDRLRELCRALGADDSGQDRKALAERILWTGRDMGAEASTCMGDAQSRDDEPHRSGDAHERGSQLIEALQRR